MARVRALARWHKHREACTSCAAIEPPGDPRLCCPAGRPPLVKLLSLNTELHRLRAGRPAAPDTQPELF